MRPSRCVASQRWACAWGVAVAWPRPGWPASRQPRLRPWARQHVHCCASSHSTRRITVATPAIRKTPRRVAAFLLDQPLQRLQPLRGRFAAVGLAGAACRPGWDPCTGRAPRSRIRCPDYAAAYQPLCSTPVQFGSSANRLRLSRSTLEQANPQHCPSTFSHLLHLCETEMLQRTRVRSLGERITHLLGPLLNGGREPDLEEVALRLQLPTWTLRRKLAEEGTRFRDLLNDTRRDLAEAYIRDTELAFGEIAYLLGLHRQRPSNAHSSAGRALRRGVSPQPAAGRLKLRGVVCRLWRIQFVSLKLEQLFLIVIHRPASSSHLSSLVMPST